MAEQLGPTIEAAEKLKIDYDYTGARQAGLSDADIADYLAAEANYDIAGAREAGVADRDIITELSTTKDEPVTAFTRGVAEGGSLSAGLGTGAVAGFQAGTLAAPALGPLAPAAPVIGAGVGALSGLALASGLNQFFIPDDQFVNVGARAAGETLGGTLSPLPVPYALAAKNPSLGASIFIHDFVKKQGGTPVRITPGEKILETVQRAPNRFGAYEIGAGAAASVVGGGLEETDPGNTLQRMSGELGAAIFLNPMNIITRAAGPAATGLKNIMSRFTPDSRQYKLGEMIVSALEEGGEDTQAVLKKLRAIRAGEVTEIEARARELGVEPGKLTTAARVQSPVLAQMQAALRKNARVGPTMDRAAIENLEAVTEIVDLLVAMDDPEALALAADMQLAQYEAMLTARLNQVETKATETAGKAFTGTQQSAAKAGQIITDMTKNVLDEARNQEKALYAKIDRTAEATADSVISAFDNIQADLLPESPFPSLITRFVNRVSGRDMEVVEDGFTAGYRETADEITQARTKADNKKDKFQSFEVKFPSARDRVDGELRYGVSIDQAIAEIKSDLGSFDNMIRDLANVASNYREKGLDVVGSDLSAVERARVASYAENLIDFLQAEQKVIDLQAYQSNYSQRLREYEAADAGRPTEVPPVTVGDLTAFRSEMLALARDARAAGKFRDANFYGRMAEAALDDLGLKADLVEGQMPTENQMALKAAHNFSRSLNDVFTRAFAGDVLGKNKTGADRLPPELLADKLLGGSANATNLKLIQLQDVARFMSTNAGEEFAETAAANLDTVKGAQQTILRTAATQFYNPETGRVNMNGLNSWMRQNQEALKAFPSLLTDLQNAGSAQKLLADTIKEDSIFRKGLDNQLALSAFLGADERPGDMIGQLIGSPNNRTKRPSKNLNAALVAARQAGDRVFDGMRSAIMDHAFTFAGGVDGRMSMKAFNDYFTKPMGRGQDSVLTIMRQQGMLSDTEAARFNKLMKEAVFIEQKLLQGKGQDIPMEDMPPALFDLVVRVIGAREGTRLAGMLNMPGSIQLPGFFAQFARNKFVVMPQSYFPDLMVQAAQEPKLMELLIEKGISGRNANQQMRFNKQLNAALINAGFLPTREELENYDMPMPSGMMLARPAAAAEMPSAQEIEQYLQQLQPPSATVPTQAQTAPLTPVSQQPPAQPARASGGAAPVNRGSYAAMFPNDPISPLINQQQNTQIQQGIGSLGPR